MSAVVQPQIDDPTAIRPFHVNFSDAEELSELRRRIAATRWPTKELVEDRSQGVQLATLRELAHYWTTEYDWRKCEARLNALPQFMTKIDGVEIHFIHAKSRHENALPLIMTHGWPGSVIELLETVGPLTDPTAHGGTSDDAFHLVLPSLPGYGFSGEPAELGWESGRIARAWAALMERLGYTRYVAQGGDVGAYVTDFMGRQAPKGLVGIHLNLLSGALAIADKLPAKSEEERAAHKALATFRTGGFGYFLEQSTRPQTIGYSLLDSPVGLAAWLLDHDTDSYYKISRAFVEGKPMGKLTRESIVDNITLYWLTATGTSAARWYWEFGQFLAAAAASGRLLRRSRYPSASRRSPARSGLPRAAGSRRCTPASPTSMRSTGAAILPRGRSRSVRGGIACGVQVVALVRLEVRGWQSPQAVLRAFLRKRPARGDEIGPRPIEYSNLAGARGCRCSHWQVRTVQAAVAVFALAAVAFAQPPADRERQLLEIIEREQAQNGPHSEGLIGPLSRLAVLYRDNGDDTLAMATIERVLQVVRANDGLHSLEQITLIQQLIAIEESIGNAAAAWDLEQRLLTLARRHPDDLRTVPVLRDAAEKRVAILARYQDGAVPPQIELGCYSGWPHSDRPSSCSGAGAKSEISRAIVSDAQRNYADAIAVLLRHRQYGSEELRVLETGIIGTILRGEVRAQSSLILVQTEVEPWRTWAAALGDIARVQVPNPTGLPLVPGRASNTWSFDYRLGRESLVRLFAYELATPSPLSVQIEAFLRIADWDLLHGENTLAMREYEQVYRLLGAARAARERRSTHCLRRSCPSYCRRTCRRRSRPPRGIRTSTSRSRSRSLARAARSRSSTRRRTPRPPTETPSSH